MHSLLLMSRQLNVHRSNYKLVEEFVALNGLEAVGEAFKHNTHRLFIPPTQYRGPYARSIGYFVLTYPSYASVVHSNVLDLRLLLSWLEKHPVTYSCKKAHANIANIQDNVNPLIVDHVDACHDLSKILRVLLV